VFEEIRRAGGAAAGRNGRRRRSGVGVFDDRIGSRRISGGGLHPHAQSEAEAQTKEKETR